MKKSINKLFEKFGYMPKEKYERLIELKNDVTAHYESIRNETETYHYFKTKEYFVVMAYCKTVDNNRMVKVFHYHDEDSEEYARICAEELCEILNEKY